MLADNGEHSGGLDTLPIGPGYRNGELPRSLGSLNALPTAWMTAPVRLNKGAREIRYRYLYAARKRNPPSMTMRWIRTSRHRSPVRNFSQRHRKCSWNLQWTDMACLVRCQHPSLSRQWQQRTLGHLPAPEQRGFRFIANQACDMLGHLAVGDVEVVVGPVIQGLETDHHGP